MMPFGTPGTSSISTFYTCTSFVKSFSGPFQVKSSSVQIFAFCIPIHMYVDVVVRLLTSGRSVYDDRFFRISLDYNYKMSEPFSEYVL